MDKTFIKLLLFLLLISSCVYGQGSSKGSTPSDSTSVKKTPAPIHIVDINFEVERTRKKLTKLSSQFKTNSTFTRIDSLLQLEEAMLQKEVKEFKLFNPNNLSKYFLENTYRAWSIYESKLVKWEIVVNNEISRTEDNIDDMDFNKKIWLLTKDKAVAREVPDELMERITLMTQEIEEMKVRFLKRRREMIIREDNITDLILITDGIRDEISHLQQRKRDDLFKANEPRLWHLQFISSDIIPAAPRLRKAWHENAKTVLVFSKEFSYLPFVLIIFLILPLYYFTLVRFRKLELTDSDPHYVAVKRIFYEHPNASIVFLLITLLIILLPNLPLIMIGILGIVLLSLSLVITPETIGPQGKLIVRFILVLYIINFGEILFWYFGSFARIYIITESIVALLLTFRYGLVGFQKNQNKSHPFVKKFRLLSLVLFLFFSVALFSSLFGFMNLAVLTLKIGVKTAAIVVIVYSAYVILRGFIFVAGEIGKKGNFRAMDNRWDKFETRGVQLLNILATVYLLKFVFQNMEIYRSIVDWLTGFLEEEWVTGTLHLSIGGILNMILIIAISIGLANLVKIIVDDVFLPKSKLAKGIPAAISVTIRYFIVTLGVIIAMSEAGINLGRFGLLAGALGVGIGFGLQNIVNNFISGLILVYGRPVNVGDTIEVENLLGTVNRIGVRSSNVRTYDGAEVVVPNGNLISNQLINWTLSDNKRRVEVKIGAAYGSDPNLVLELLEKVAMGHEDVLKDPKPRALFEEFGDSSLNFRLLYWVPFERGVGSKSDISIGVYNIFAQNNIQIPFPQVDLHVKDDAKETKAKLPASTKAAADSEAKAKTSTKKKSKPVLDKDPEPGDAEYPAGDKN